MLYKCNGIYLPNGSYDYCLLFSNSPYSVTLYAEFLPSQARARCLVFIEVRSANILAIVFYILYYNLFIVVKNTIIIHFLVESVRYYIQLNLYYYTI